jgi:signal transduction histidine kinase
MFVVEYEAGQRQASQCQGRVIMTALTSGLSLDEPSTLRADSLYQEQLDANYRRTDRMFAWLMVMQWPAGVAAALWISPRAWEGQYSSTHIHVWAAIILGALIPSLPLFLILTRPGSALTRHTIVVAQMLTSGLLVHLTGGRIETHFHYFGSLAFLAFYRDWRLLVSATIIVAVDHFIRGVFWPQSIFGVTAPSSWRWAEHAGWVLFEDFFLVLAIRQNLREMRDVAERQAKLETVNETVERTVTERTQELKNIHERLREISRQAGMAEIATNVLHNVGNVLNSVNVSTTLAMDAVKRSKVSRLAQVVDLMKSNERDLGLFISSDTRGRQLPGYLAQLSDHLISEQESTVKELDSLRKNVDHIKTIVAMQQNYAKVSGVMEVVTIAELVDDVLHMNNDAFSRHGVEVKRDYEHIPPLVADKHKILQIMMNLVRNAERACTESGREDKRLTVRVSDGDGRAKISVLDNGVGIPPENLTLIFNQGFTTKHDGHGFGLHSSALAAKEMGGSLTVRSDGLGHGALFTLELPKNKAHPAEKN